MRRFDLISAAAATEGDAVGWLAQSQGYLAKVGIALDIQNADPTVTIPALAAITKAGAKYGILNAGFPASDVIAQL